MADEKISAMTVLSSLDSTDVVPVVKVDDPTNYIANMSVLKLIMANSPVYIGTKWRLIADDGPPTTIKLEGLNNSAVWEEMWTYTTST